MLCALERRKQDGPFIQYLPRRLKEPDLSALVPTVLNQCLKEIMFCSTKFRLLILPFNILIRDMRQALYSGHYKIMLNCALVA